MSHIFGKTLVLSFIYSNCDSNYEKVFKEKEWIKILKILDLINDF